jgi:rifampicin phosphotransferase
MAAEPHIEGRPVEQLWALRHRVLLLASRTATAELAVAAAAAAAAARLEHQLVRYLGREEGVRWAREVTAELSPTTALTMAAEVAHVVAAGAPDVISSPWSAAREALVATGDGELAEAVVRTARHAGSRAVFAGPTWAEDLDAFWDLVIGMNVRGRSGLVQHADVDDLATHLAARPGWRRTRILTGQVVDVRLILVRRLVQDTVTLLSGRESTKAGLLMLGGLVRRIDLELGSRLQAAGLLALATDVVHLSTNELAELLAGGDGPSAFDVVRRRRAVEQWAADAGLPSSFVGVPHPVAVAFPAGDRMQGWGASPGRFTGPARVMRRPRAALVQPGDVVVAERTDASWTPVFLRAGALVVAEGGPLSHAAIVAREFGLPAVVNVPGVVEWLRQGDDPVMVTVDGDDGTVVRHARDREPLGVT